MKELFQFTHKLFKEPNYTISKLCKTLGIKNHRYDLEEVNYSRNEMSTEDVRWFLLFEKKNKNENIYSSFKKDIFKNKYIWKYAVVIDENMTICDIYEDYTIYNGRNIEGRLETSYNGKKIVDNELQKYINERHRIHQNGSDRLKIMTKTLKGSRY